MRKKKILRAQKEFREIYLYEKYRSVGKTRQRNSQQLKFSKLYLGLSKLILLVFFSSQFAKSGAKNIAVDFVP